MQPKRLVPQPKVLDYTTQTFGYFATSGILFLKKKVLPSCPDSEYPFVIIKTF
jgi:hypothetical protein